MKNYLKSSIILTALMLVLIGAYTLIVYGMGKFLPNHGEGEQIVFTGKRFYGNVAQKFTSPGCFHPRPSAVNYNAGGSGGSNKGPSNPELIEVIHKRIDTLRMQNPEMLNSQIPVDLVTASGSGLDPNISLAGAEYQIKRVAKFRNLDESKIRKLVTESIESSTFGPSKINVLKLNMALDQIK